jgi:catechol 2,3-dioxygenase-like lactoylglutathione lyase family enzyme
MVETHGLTHISLAVRDPEKSLEFYVQLLGCAFDTESLAG